ncbi:MAG: DDE-type integrase/transposase/recombinase [Mycobacterium sp.]
MATYTELTAAGVTTRTAARLTGLPRSTATRATAVPVLEPAARRVPANRLSAMERLEILAVLDAPRFVDLPPIQIWAQLLDEGTYLCSISTLYRILAENAQLVERRRIARHPARTVPELVATGPGQVYTWDITKLAGPVKGIYYDAYVMIDIYSRYIVGAKVHPHESGQLAADMMAQVFDLHGTPQVVHADSEYGSAGVPGFPDSHADGPVKMLVSRLPRAS